ncbi:hypothetical protein [Trujillonella endophytica]|uniref:MYXO-CTERM domain-containing protein n=1 Tax=Trujillonella endophytica TaxID=673521 RepID=A0A1H8WSL5_9ACTN|nr:hypothetical protein [Trujillella endophytica]SEP30427.1 hypothetical protein SAMN05660991_04679 [Trujillella endophytica]
MAGSSRNTGSRIRARIARLATIGVIAALALIFTPGTASANTGVAPIVDCYRYNNDGTFWVVLGYTNPGSQKTYAYGTTNQVYPTRLQGQQPKQFAAGTVHGVWTVRLTYAEIFQQDARWVLNGTTLRYSQYVNYAQECPPSTVLPADGNGTGTAVALGAAGVVGAAVLVRHKRRLNRLADSPPSPDAGA